MPNFRLHFSGECRKVQFKQAGQKTIAELQLCKKNYTKDGEEPTFTWIKVNVWEPKEFQKFSEGCFVAGSGELTTRSYEGKNGKGTSVEVRCTSFDIEVARQMEKVDHGSHDNPNPKPSPKVPAPAPYDDLDSPPF